MGGTEAPRVDGGLLGEVLAADALALQDDVPLPIEAAVPMAPGIPAPKAHGIVDINIAGNQYRGLLPFGSEATLVNHEGVDIRVGQDAPHLNRMEELGMLGVLEPPAGIAPQQGSDDLHRNFMGLLLSVSLSRISPGISNNALPQGSATDLRTQLLQMAVPQLLHGGPIMAA